MRSFQALAASPVPRPRGRGGGGAQPAGRAAAPGGPATSGARGPALMPGGRPGGWGGGGGSGAWPRRFRDRGRRAPFLPLFKVLGRGKPQPSLPGASTGLRWGFLRGGGARGSLPSETGLGGEAGAAPPHRRRAPARRLIPPRGRFGRRAGRREAVAGRCGGRACPGLRPPSLGGKSSP